jgi:hypothetical protein
MAQVVEYSFPVARTILAQMGGVGRLKAFVGAHSFTLGDLDVRFVWPMQARSKPNALIVRLCGDDTYTLEFSRVGKGETKILKTLEGIYFDQLVELFEKETGLYLHF